MSVSISLNLSVRLQNDKLLLWWLISLWRAPSKSHKNNISNRIESMFVSRDIKIGFFYFWSTNSLATGKRMFMWIAQKLASRALRSFQISNSIHILPFSHSHSHSLDAIEKFHIQKRQSMHENVLPFLRTSFCVNMNLNQWMQFDFISFFLR